MVWVQGALLILTVTILVLLLLGRGSRRHSWVNGYWTGRAELHASLGAMLMVHEAELSAHPELLAGRLKEWILESHEGDRALAQAQMRSNRG